MTQPPLDLIFVVQGAEYKAVYRGICRLSCPKPKILAIPIGSASVITYLRRWQQSEGFFRNPPARVLLMGLSGSLSPQYQVGDRVIYQSCSSFSAENDVAKLWLDCDPDLTELLANSLENKLSRVKGLTSDRIICSAKEKQELGQEYLVDVVDMESYKFLKNMREIGIKTAIIRVISDNCDHDLPDLNKAISSDGLLRPFPLTVTMLQKPLAAFGLIQGSLKALKVLENLSFNLYSNLSKSSHKLI